MTDMTMRERIARVIYCATTPREPWEACGAGVHQLWLSAADAVLAAMREPDEKMQRHGKNALSSNGVDCAGCDDSRMCWQAMIDAALEPKPSGPVEEFKTKANLAVQRAAPILSECVSNFSALKTEGKE